MFGSIRTWGQLDVLDMWSVKNKFNVIPLCHSNEKVDENRTAGVQAFFFVGNTSKVRHL